MLQLRHSVQSCRIKKNMQVSILTSCSGRYRSHFSNPSDSDTSMYFHFPSVTIQQSRSLRMYSRKKKTKSQLSRLFVDEMSIRSPHPGYSVQTRQGESAAWPPSRCDKMEGTARNPQKKTEAPDDLRASRIGGFWLCRCCHFGGDDFSSNDTTNKKVQTLESIRRGSAKKTRSTYKLGRLRGRPKQYSFLRKGAKCTPRPQLKDPERISKRDASPSHSMRSRPRSSTAWTPWERNI